MNIIDIIIKICLAALLLSAALGLVYTAVVVIWAVIDNAVYMRRRKKLWKEHERKLREAQDETEV
nr:hypothetical protein [Oscillospiraceae bacterium]